MWFSPCYEIRCPRPIGRWTGEVILPLTSLLPLSMSAQPSSRSLLHSFSELLYDAPIEGLAAFRELNGQKARESCSLFYPDRVSILATLFSASASCGVTGAGGSSGSSLAPHVALCHLIAVAAKGQHSLRHPRGVRLKAEHLPVPPGVREGTAAC